ncbi:hypothetical protein PTKIN_Ptkin05aG0106900 [Pterospermum kingtungense]
MSSENEDQCSVPQSKPDDRIREFHKKLKFSYSRDFLFSVAELDICRRLPTGFDSSILRELDDQSTSVLHSYHDSGAGRYKGILSHCSWRNPEQGLLGSGASAVHRGVAETSVHVVRGSGFHLLNRSSEPYRPPHLCKAKFYSGEDSKDHYNDETFGSPDNLSQGRSEEEKLRRDSFELMRKEQEMATQQKKKNISNEQRENLDSNIAIVMEDSGVHKKVANMYIKSKPCDVKEDQAENLVFCSSDLTFQFLEGEKKTADDQEVIEYDCTKVSFGTIAFGHNLMKSASTHVAKEMSMELYHLYGCCNPGVLSCECLEDSILSEIYGRYSTQHQLINRGGSYDVGNSQSSCSSYDAASEHFLSFSQKGSGLTDLAESSKPNMWSSDTPYVSETGNDNHQLNKSTTACINNFDNNLFEPISGNLAMDSHSTALPGTQKDLTSWSKQNDPMESQIPLPVVDNYIIPLMVNESGSNRDDGGILFSSFDKQTDLRNRNSNLLVPSVQDKEGLDLRGGPESKQSSVSSFHEIGIFLPDEDSLITLDDCILPQDSMFVDAGVTSSAPESTFERLSYSGPAVDYNKSDLAGFGSPTSYHGSNDLVSFETYLNSLHMRQSYPKLHHSQLKPVKARTSLPKSQANQKGSRIRPRDLKSYPHDLHSVQNFSTNVHLSPSQHLRAAATGFDHYGNYQLPQELPVLGNFPHQQLHGMPRVAFPQRTSCQMAGFQNPTLNSSHNFKQCCYENLENASPRNFEMEIESKADASSPTTAGHIQKQNVWQTG